MTVKHDCGGQNTEAEHKLVIIDRKSISLSGVVDVVSFDETGAVLRTSSGTLAIDGEGLHVVKLDVTNGNMTVDGKLNGMFYSEAGGSKNRSKRLFR